MAKSLDDVISQMRERGLELPARVDLDQAFRRYLRFRPMAERANKKTAWIRLYEYRSPTSGQTYITGAFGVRGDTWPVEAASKDWSPAERAAELEARKAAAKAAEADLAKDHQIAAEKARKMWDRGRDANECGEHPYLQRKQVGAYGLRVGFNQRLMVPLRDVHGALHGLQYIAPDGTKLFGTGTAKEGKFHQIGEVAADRPIAFGEGYATCASAYMATEWPVVVCFDAGNLVEVMGAWRKLYPDHRFVILADDDRHLLQRLSARLMKLGVAASPQELARLGEWQWDLPDGRVIELRAAWKEDANGGPHRIEGALVEAGVTQMLKLENAGRSKAALAAKKYRADVLWPTFDPPEAPGTDWNDLHLIAGLAGVREALLRAFAAPPPPKKRANGSPQGGGGAKRAEEHLAALQAPGEQGLTFFERFALIYGTTTVWDAQMREIYKLEALNVAHGKIMDTWLASPSRWTVPKANVVFDPTGQCRAPEYVNLFDRLPLQPNPMASCGRIVRHFFELCHEDDKLLHWFLCWLAYPLQHPGAKMRTAVILHGRTEGTGKSLAMDIMRSIYGRYARSITQRQIQSEFNGWQSGMLLCIAEEVLSRQDRAELQGLIQNMITNPVIQINEKNMPVREERNYTNFVFLSNHPIPMLLNDTDRRFTVIKVERQHAPEYFRELGQEIDAGGTESFLDYLLRYDLGDFNEHTRPYDNKARVALITMGMTPDRRFFEHWRHGMAGVPFCTCSARDLYTAFKAWAKVNGERYIANKTAFGLTITDCLDQLGAPRKASVRWQGFGEKAIEAGIGGDDHVNDYQSTVYFVPEALQRLGTSEDDEYADRVKAALEAGQDPPEDRCRDPATYNKRIQAFEHRLTELIASARRAL